jgi:CheY-like chemotaxis protein
METLQFQKIAKTNTLGECEEVGAMANILIVDDTPLTHRLLNLMLQRIDNSLNIFTAYNGKEALDQLAENAFDLVITDINMPGMDGFALMDEMRADDKYKDLPIIVLTASGHKKIPAMAAQKGATSFLTQPISSWELKETVTRCLKGTIVGLSH